LSDLIGNYDFGYSLTELEEMRKDGGVVAIIEKFKKFSAGQ